MKNDYDPKKFDGSKKTWPNRKERRIKIKQRSKKKSPSFFQDLIEKFSRAGQISKRSIKKCKGIQKLKKLFRK